MLFAYSKKPCGLFQGTTKESLENASAAMLKSLASNLTAVTDSTLTQTQGALFIILYV